MCEDCQKEIHAFIQWVLKESGTLIDDGTFKAIGLFGVWVAWRRHPDVSLKPKTETQR